MEQNISPGAVKVRQVRGRRTPDGTCRHHFILGDSRVGAKVMGTCCNCGETREFANGLDGAKAKGLDPSTLIDSLLNQGRVTREVPLKRPTLGQAAEGFRTGKGGT